MKKRSEAPEPSTVGPRRFGACSPRGRSEPCRQGTPIPQGKSGRIGRRTPTPPGRQRPPPPGSQRGQPTGTAWSSRRSSSQPSLPTDSTSSLRPPKAVRRMNRNRSPHRGCSSRTSDRSSFHLAPNDCRDESLCAGMPRPRTSGPIAFPRRLTIEERARGRPVKRRGSKASAANRTSTQRYVGNPGPQGVTRCTAAPRREGCGMHGSPAARRSRPRRWTRPRRSTRGSAKAR